MPQATSEGQYVPPGVGPTGATGGTLPTWTHTQGVSAVVTLQESIGAQDIYELSSTDSYIHLYASDVHTTETATGYDTSELTGATIGGTVYTYERWVRVKFAPSFNMITRIRVWATGATLHGWDLRWGTTSTYQLPKVTQSTIAINPVPTADTFIANVGPAQLLGPDTGYSDWIVLQASCTPDSAVEIGAMSTLGVQLNVAWGEMI